MHRLTKGNTKATSLIGRGNANMSTDGVDLNLWPCEVEGDGASKHKITFSVWDFAGQGMRKRFRMERDTN